LTYYYDDAARPDRLTRVVDTGNATKGFKYNTSATSPHYTYDLNGNLTNDKHKDLFFNYNHLNLPNSIFNSGGADITLTYTADGEKLTKISIAGTRNYVAGIEYLGTCSEAIYHGEGRCTPKVKHPCASRISAPSAKRQASACSGFRACLRRQNYREAAFAIYKSGIFSTLKTVAHPKQLSHEQRHPRPHRRRNGRSRPCGNFKRTTRHL